ncbi:MAG: DUF2202 domain-containing protein [Sphingomonadaceae bacterium]
MSILGKDKIVMQFSTFVSLPVLAIAALGLSACYNAPTSAQASTSTSVVDSDAPALLTALDDEYKAEATYAAVIEKFGEVRPFINIIRAEQMHKKMAEAELNRLAVQYPHENPYTGKINAPNTLLEACQIGITAEEENIALYDRLLPNVSDPQVRAVLTQLQAASRDRHLPAFQRCVARGGRIGAGMGNGAG